MVIMSQRGQTRISRATCWIHMATSPRGISCSCSWSWSSRCYRLSFALVLLCIISFAFLPIKSVSAVKVDIINKSNSKGMMMRTMSSKFMLGSRPPRCVNRCMNCWPCTAVLVIPPHRKQTRRSSSTTTTVRSISAPHDDEGYYLVSWKCRCKNKLFQP